MRQKHALAILIALMLLLNIIYIVHMQRAISNLEYKVDVLTGHIDTLYDNQLYQAKSHLRLVETVESWIKNWPWEMDIFESSAYSPLDDRNGMNSWGDGSVMASGLRTIDHIDDAVAVDPKLIPLGSRVWIQGLGWRVALDTGGAIRGKKIDICMRTFDEAVEYGRKKVTVIYPKRGEF